MYSDDAGYIHTRHRRPNRRLPPRAASSPCPLFARSIVPRFPATHRVVVVVLLPRLPTRDPLLLRFRALSRSCVRTRERTRSAYITAVSRALARARVVSLAWQTVRRHADISWWRTHVRACARVFPPTLFSLRQIADGLARSTRSRPLYRGIRARSHVTEEYN